MTIMAHLTWSRSSTNNCWLGDYGLGLILSDLQKLVIMRAVMLSLQNLLQGALLVGNAGLIQLNCSQKVFSSARS